MDSFLLEDNPHWIKNTHRKLLVKALAYMSAKEIVAIIGARRVTAIDLRITTIYSLLLIFVVLNIICLLSVSTTNRSWLAVW
jgi:hypothetical protein